MVPKPTRSEDKWHKTTNTAAPSKELKRNKAPLYPKGKFLFCRPVRRRCSAWEISGEGPRMDTSKPHSKQGTRFATKGTKMGGQTPREKQDLSETQGHGKKCRGGDKLRSGKRGKKMGVRSIKKYPVERGGEDPQKSFLWGDAQTRAGGSQARTSATQKIK